LGSAGCGDHGGGFGCRGGVDVEGTMTDEPNPTVDAVAALLIEHARYDIRGCRCGWADLGKSHAAHVAKVLDAAGLLAAETGPKPPPDTSWIRMEER
jgi:hypothetical protein